MKKEFNFKNAKRVGDRFKDKEIKVSVTTRLDPDIVSWLRDEAEEAGMPYQTFMNSLLRKVMKQKETLTEDRIRLIVREELTKREEKTKEDKLSA